MFPGPLETQLPDQPSDLEGQGAHLRNPKKDSALWPLDQHGAGEGVCVCEGHSSHPLHVNSPCLSGKQQGTTPPTWL